MKLESQHSPTLSNSNSISTMGIAQGAEAQISRMLRDQVYSNKILAVVREYVCNAHDEHVKYNIKQPIEVKVTEKSFSVRDFAKGLSDDGVRSIFGKYGASTKQDTNTLIGGFGIGSKSGHAYSDTFIITSYFEGKKTTYACVLGGTGAVQIGEIHELAQEDTNETGIEISIDIKEGDYNNYLKTSNKFCSVSGFNIRQFFDGKVCEPLKVLKTEQLENCNVRLVELNNNNLGSLDYARKSNIMMGGVVYKSGFIKHYNKLKDNKAIFFDFNVGELSVSLSRESFENNESLNRARNLIRDWVEQKEKEDLESLRNVDFEDFIKEDFMGTGLGEYQMLQGEVFQFEARVVFSAWEGFKGKLRKVSNEEILKDEEGKFPIVLLPNVSSTTHWENKVRNFLADKGNTYMIRESIFYSLSEDDQSLFSISKARSLKYPKSPRGGRYKLYIKTSSVGDFNDIGVFNYIFETEFDDEQDCRDHAAEFYKNSDFKEVSQFYPYLISEGGPSMYSSIPSCCNTLYKKVRKLGVLSLYDQVIKDKMSEINKRKEEEQKRLDLKYKFLKTIALVETKKEIEMFKNYPIDKLERLVKSVEKIRNANNLRTKIIGDNYYGSKYTRKELKKILQFTK